MLANDYDPDTADGRRLLVSRVEGSAANVGNLIILASGAGLVLNADGSFTYDPRQAFDGLDPFTHPRDSFTYTVSDPQGHESSTTVTISIAGRNDPPVARPDAGITDADAQLRLHVVANDSDPEQASLRVIAIDDAHKDFVRINPDGTLTYDPAGRFDFLARGETATDTFYYTIDDGLGGRASSQVTVTVHGTGRRAAGRRSSKASRCRTAVGSSPAGAGCRAPRHRLSASFPAPYRGSRLIVRRIWTRGSACWRWARPVTATARSNST